MERREFMKWLIGLSAIGIFCIFLFGRPSVTQSTGLSWTYTSPPPTLPARIPVFTPVASASAGVSATVAPPPPVPATDATPAPPLTTAPAPFMASSVVNMPLREAVATIAKSQPDWVIRPVQLGTSVPPSSPNPKRVTLEYDPSTLAVTRTTMG